MVTTSIFVSGAYDAVTDRYGTLAVYRRDRPEFAEACLTGTMA